MAITPPVLLLEFNELAPRLMDQFMAAGQLPNFKILHDESEIYGTEAVEKYPYLELWIQWITVRVPLTVIAPTILKMLRVPPPEFMRGAA